MLISTTNCFKLNLPPLPNNLKSVLQQLANSIPINEQKRSWLENFHGNAYTIAGQEYGTENTNINLAIQKDLNSIYEQYFPNEDIWYTIGKIQAYNKSNSTIPPHCDRGRQTAINFILETGGSNVKTVFYNYIRTDNDLSSAVNLTVDKLEIESLCIMQHNSWYTFNAQQAHGVKDVLGTRLIFSVVLGSNLNFNSFLSKYQHLLR